MKLRYYFIALLLFCCTSVSQTHAQGAFGGPEVAFLSVNNQFGVLMGGRGGFFIKDYLNIGGAGFSLLVPKEYGIVNDTLSRLRIGYGGGVVEGYWYFANRVNLSGMLLIGGGSSSLTFDNNGADKQRSQDGFVILQPGLNINLMPANHLRFSIGVSYRRTFGLALSQTNITGFHGLTGGIGVHFGSF